ncbi:hypothetical protein BGX30_011644 [Mortierella sp. GBA39]|nr:hypothetical protein BGX30_011644 [Mortierella sp. GBA39]
MTSDTHQHQQSGLSARLSYSDFEVAINAFLHQTRHHTPWSNVEYSPRRDDIPDGEQEEEDDPVVENSTSTTTFDYLSVNYHIVFSPSYQVPVLYFNAYRPDGPAISLEEIYESLVPEEWRGAIRNAGLNGGISQQDHPVLNTPYFYMHPCETVPLMETILQNNGSTSGTPFLESYIVTWLSFTGQAIGVSVPTDMVATNGQ